jgi:hypothetical protein
VCMCMSYACDALLSCCHALGGLRMSEQNKAISRSLPSSMRMTYDISMRIVYSRNFRTHIRSTYDDHTRAMFEPCQEELNTIMPPEDKDRLLEYFCCCVNRQRLSFECHNVKHQATCRIPEASEAPPTAITKLERT